MNGYQYLIERNRLLIKLQEAIDGLQHLPDVERRARKGKLQTEFDRKVAELYAQVAGEFPGERRKKARPIADPR